MMYSSNIFTNNSKRGHGDSSIKHWNQVICILMRSPFELFCLSAIESFVVVDRLPFESLNLRIELLLFDFLLFLLSLRPFEDSLGLLLVLCELLFF